MKILIGNNKLKQKLKNTEILQRNFGNIADLICMRLQYLEAAETLADVSHLPPINRHTLSGNYKGCFAVSVDRKYRIIFKPLMESKTDLINLSNIKEINIVAIENYH